MDNRLWPSHSGHLPEGLGRGRWRTVEEWVSLSISFSWYLGLTIAYDNTDGICYDGSFWVNVADSSHPKTV
jgi:hypothetical protein